MELSTRAQTLKPSPTLALAARAKELAAKGHDVISLSVGEPDWDTFEPVKQAAIESIRKGATKYTPAAGLPSLRQTIADVTNRELKTNYSAAQVTVTAGGKFVLFSAFQMLLSPGDEVIIPAPYWVSYPTMVELAQGVPRIVACGEEQRFKMTAAQLRAAITPKTKMLILNSPSNPTGEVYSRNELKELADVLREFPRVIVVSDDIYNRLVFTPEGLAPHILHVAPEMIDRTVVVNGASKAFSMTGWRVGWAVGPKDLISAMTDYQSQSVSCAATPSLYAAEFALKNSDQDIAQAREKLKVRRDLFVSLINKIPGFKVQAPDGAFYLWVNVTERLKQKGYGSKEFSEELLNEKYVAAVPGAEFGLEGYLRLSYALSEERIRQACERMM
jgi:aspartate aminotransferase